MSSLTAKLWAQDQDKSSDLIFYDSYAMLIYLSNVVFYTMLLKIEQSLIMIHLNNVNFLILAENMSNSTFHS